MGSRLPIALAALLVLAAGCSSGSKTKQDEAASGPAVPWTDEQAPQTKPREPVTTPCRASDLTVEGKVRFVPLLTGGIALVPLRNSSTRVCRLSGQPTVRLVHEGRPGQKSEQALPTPRYFPDVPYPQSSLLALRPGESAAVTVKWDNWCDPATGAQRRPPTLRLTLPHGGGHIDADYNAVPDCITPGTATSIGVSQFQPGLVPTGRPWPGGSSLRASLAGPKVHARRGGIARFRVVLRNVSQQTVRFDTCPAYEEQLAPAGKVEVYKLNCAAAHPIAPGEELAFSIRLRVPQKALLGANGLFWALDPFGAHSPQVHGRVVVDR